MISESLTIWNYLAHWIQHPIPKWKILNFYDDFITKEIFKTCNVLPFSCMYSFSTIKDKAKSLRLKQNKMLLQISLFIIQ